MTPLLFGVNVYISTHWSISSAQIRSRLCQYGAVTVNEYYGGPTRLVSRCNAVFAEAKAAEKALNEAPLSLDDHEIHLRIHQSAMSDMHRTSSKRREPKALDRAGRIALLQRATHNGQVAASSVITALEALDDSNAGLCDENIYALAVNALSAVGECERAVALLNEAKDRGMPSPLDHPAMAGSTIVALIASERPLDESMRILRHVSKLDLRGFNALITAAESQDRDDLLLEILSHRAQQTNATEVKAASFTSDLTSKRAFLETAYHSRSSSSSSAASC